jgi:hypothetical protein
MRRPTQRQRFLFGLLFGLLAGSALTLFSRSELACRLLDSVRFPGSGPVAHVDTHQIHYPFF